MALNRHLKLIIKNFQTWSKILLHKRKLFFVNLVWNSVFTRHFYKYALWPYFSGTNENRFIFPGWCIMMTPIEIEIDTILTLSVGGGILLTTVLFLCWHKHVIHDKLINTILINKPSGQASRTEPGDLSCGDIKMYQHQQHQQKNW